MSIESIIKDFCSHSNQEREQTGNGGSPVASTGSLCSRCSREENQIQLLRIVIRCSYALNIDPIKIIDDYFSDADEQELLSGRLPDQDIRAMIKLWIDAGMPYNSGKIKNSTLLITGDKQHDSMG